MIKPILLDVDGVLLNWMDSFKVYMRHQGYPWHEYAVQDYDMVDNFKLSREEIDEHIITFNNGHWEFGTLSPIEGAVKALQELDDYPLVAITSCSTHPQAVALRKANLYNHFDDHFEAVHCVDFMGSKRTHLADYEPTIWIEDNYENCIDGLDYGHKCILMDQPWNKLYSNPDIIRCHTWEEITQAIYRLQNES